mmetsp:Transcript_4580/g.13077  ORF Transcript_4580/g.13077 Transcript_4580/m.13077 type:complete len:210 (-) Transcript_4580:300-929(-)
MSTAPAFLAGASSSYFQAFHASTVSGKGAVGSTDRARFRKSTSRSSVQSSKRANVLRNHCLWKAGEMTRRRAFQTSGSAGINPLPRIGAKISARMPLSKFWLPSRSRYRAMLGSATTIKERGPKASLNTGPSSLWYFVRSRKRGPPTKVCRSPAATLPKNVLGPALSRAPCQSQDATSAPSSESLPRMNWSRLLNKIRNESWKPGLLPG